MLLIQKMTYGLGYAMQCTLKNSPGLPPSNLEQLGSSKCQQAAEVAARHEGNKTPILAITSRKNLSSNGNSSQCTKRKRKSR